jgi:Ca-activated chloride channel family protein
MEKARECMKLALDGLNPQDTFNLITFSGNTHILFPEPVPATRESLARAQEFLASRSAGGGTEMMKAITAALEPSDASDHIRIVCFMTDGYVGNDFEIISEVQKHPNARVFAFGIGSSVNRFLLDKMSEEGRGEVEYVTLGDNGSAAAKRFYERVRNPILTDISIDWGGLQVEDVYPSRIPDLFSAKPVVLTGRYKNPGSGVVKLTGRIAAGDFIREIPVELSDQEPRHDVLATLWARRRIDDLMSQSYAGMHQGTAAPDVTEAITQLGLLYRLMTQYTSFVAVEEMTVTDGGEPRRVEVPVDMPEGVSHQGVFGETDALGRSYLMIGGLATGTGGGMGRGTGRRVGQTVQESEVVVTASRTGAASAPAPPSSAPSLPRPRTTVTDSVKPSAKKPRGEQPDADLTAKLDPQLLGLLDRLKRKDSQPDAAERRFVRNGKAEVQIFLTDKSPATLAQLKKLRFEILLEPKTANILIGRIPIEKLAALAEIKAVRYVAPMT